VLTLFKISDTVALHEEHITSLREQLTPLLLWHQLPLLPVLLPLLLLPCTELWGTHTYLTGWQYLGKTFSGHTFQLGQPCFSTDTK
jgi:hypothetical protein